MRKPKRKARRSAQQVAPARIRPDAAGIDIGAREVYVAVGAGHDPEPVRCFSTFTVDLQRMAAWLVECGVTTVAMESTGVYWIPPYDILEAHGIEVCLVNAQHVKNVPGRKRMCVKTMQLPWTHTARCRRLSDGPNTLGPEN